MIQLSGFYFRGKEALPRFLGGSKTGASLEGVPKRYPFSSTGSQIRGSNKFRSVRRLGCCSGLSESESIWFNAGA